MEFSTPPSSLKIYIGDKFIFSIESNPSTGYTWQVASGMNENVVKLNSQVFIEKPSTTTPAPVGVPGKDKFAFTATGAGQVAITLNYVRPWETDVAPARTQVISVTVTQPGSLKEIESDIPPSSLEIYTADRFIFSIESNPSTGYTWQVAPGLNENVVKLSSQEYIATPSTTTPPPVGVPGKDKFAFTAIGAGHATITLNYVRPWETDVDPEQTVVISVTVK
jgi:inhibitor of cysteine peptidase